MSREKANITQNKRTTGQYIHFNYITMQREKYLLFLLASHFSPMTTWWPLWPASHAVPRFWKVKSASAHALFTFQNRDGYASPFLMTKSRCR